METTKLSSKGQVILPVSIRLAKQWRAGVEFAVENTADGGVAAADQAGRNDDA